MNFLAVNDSCAVQESAVKEENEIDTLIERYYEALKYHKIGDEAAAIDCYEEICSSSLSEKEIENKLMVERFEKVQLLSIKNLVDLYSGARNYTAAIECCLTGLSIDLKDEDIWEKLGECAFADNNIPLCRLVLKKRLSTCPDNIFLLQKLADLMKKAFDFNGCKVVAQSILAKEPKSSSAKRLLSCENEAFTVPDVDHEMNEAEALIVKIPSNCNVEEFAAHLNNVFEDCLEKYEKTTRSSMHCELKLVKVTFQYCASVKKSKLHAYENRSSRASKEKRSEFISRVKELLASLAIAPSNGLKKRNEGETEEILDIVELPLEQFSGYNILDCMKKFLLFCFNQNLENSKMISKVSKNYFSHCDPSCYSPEDFKFLYWLSLTLRRDEPSDFRTKILMCLDCYSFEFNHERESMFLLKAQLNILPQNIRIYYLSLCDSSESISQVIKDEFELSLLHDKFKNGSYDEIIIALSDKQKLSAEESELLLKCLKHGGKIDEILTMYKAKLLETDDFNVAASLFSEIQTALRDGKSPITSDFHPHLMEFVTLAVDKPDFKESLIVELLALLIPEMPLEKAIEFHDYLFSAQYTDKFFSERLFSCLPLISNLDECWKFLQCIYNLPSLIKDDFVIERKEDHRWNASDAHLIASIIMKLVASGEVNKKHLAPMLDRLFAILKQPSVLFPQFSALLDLNSKKLENMLKRPIGPFKHVNFMYPIETDGELLDFYYVCGQYKSEYSANLCKYDIILNHDRIESWEKLSNFYFICLEEKMKLGDVSLKKVIDGLLKSSYWTLKKSISLQPESKDLLSKYLKVLQWCQTCKVALKISLNVEQDLQRIMLNSPISSPATKLSFLKLFQTKLTWEVLVKKIETLSNYGINEDLKLLAASVLFQKSLEGDVTACESASRILQIDPTPLKFIEMANALSSESASWAFLSAKWYLQMGMLNEAFTAASSIISLKKYAKIFNSSFKRVEEFNWIEQREQLDLFIDILIAKKDVANLKKIKDKIASAKNNIYNAEKLIQKITKAAVNKD